MSAGPRARPDTAIVVGARMPMATYNTYFRDLSEIELCAIAAREALRRSRVDPERLERG